MRRAVLGLAAAAVALFVANCGGGGGGTNNNGGGPGPTPVVHTSLSATVTASGAEDGNGYTYTVDIRLLERGGLGARMNRITLLFSDGNGAFGSVDFDGDGPWTASNPHVPANSELNTKHLIVTDSNASTFATKVDVTITYNEDAAQTGGGPAGTVTASATIPALPAPPPGSKFTLSGTVTETPGSFKVRDVRIEVRDGSNAGRSATTDGNGRYSLSGLVTGSFTVRASKKEYGSVDQKVRLTSSKTLDFSLKKSASAMGAESQPCVDSTCGGEEGSAAALGFEHRLSTSIR